MSTHSILNRLHPQGNNRQPPQNFMLLKKAAPAPTPQWHKALFEDSLLEINSGHRRRRVWTGAFSVALLESVLVALVVIVPLWYPEMLPKAELMTFLTTPPPPPAAPPPPPAASTASKAARMTSNMVNGRLLAPSLIPSKILMIKEAEAPPSGGVIGGVIGGVPGGQPGGVLGGIFNSPSHPVVVLAPGNPAPQRVRISQGVTEGMIISKITPVYPPIARAARVEGVVVLKAVIDRNGNIQNLGVVSGPTLLVSAAIDAVRQWRYRPYLLNGKPVEVETTVQVIFQIQ